MGFGVRVMKLETLTLRNLNLFLGLGLRKKQPISKPITFTLTPVFAMLSSLLVKG